MSFKSFTKAICKANNIPTSASENFTDIAKAEAYIRTQGAPIVVKADGLAAGKGVIVASTLAEAEDAVLRGCGAIVLTDEASDATRVGLPTVFVRLTGCPLRCNWCDTPYALDHRKAENVLSGTDIIAEITNSNGYSNASPSRSASSYPDFRSD